VVRHLVEKRFPLDLKPSLDQVWQLYNDAKAAHWDPARDLPWAQLDASALPAEVREAAALVWSHRVWLGYGPLAATPALLVRFCLELRREADPKYFLSVRGTEEALHVDACVRFANRLGGYVAQPPDAAMVRLFDRATYAAALDGDVPLEALVAADMGLRLSIELGQLRAAAAASSDPVAAAVLERLAADKARHLAFGHLYLEARRDRIDAAVGEAAASRASQLLADELAGLTVPALSPAAPALAAAYARTAEAGLGAAPAEAALVAFREAVADARARLAAVGIGLPEARHEALGPL